MVFGADVPSLSPGPVARPPPVSNPTAKARMVVVDTSHKTRDTPNRTSIWEATAGGFALLLWFR